jgi:hypothetical protein
VFSSYKEVIKPSCAEQGQSQQKTIVYMSMLPRLKGERLRAIWVTSEKRRE